MEDEKQSRAGEIVAQSGPDRTRRRLTGSALGASVIFTLASRPVLADVCLSPSGFASGNLSKHGTPVVCQGKSPATWAGQNQNTYPGGNPKFRDEFSPSNGSGTAINWAPSDRLKDVMGAADNSNATPKPNPISKEFAAALLNIRAGSYQAGIDEGSLKAMWHEYATTGQYQVTASVFWNPNQIVAYLQYLRS
jgi:hypothetical protein